MAALKKQRPLIRYAGSAAETSIGSKPIGSELGTVLYCERRRCQASLASACRAPLLILAHTGCLSQAGTPNTAARHAVAGVLHDQNRWFQ